MHLYSTSHGVTGSQLSAPLKVYCFWAHNKLGTKAVVNQPSNSPIVGVSSCTQPNHCVGVVYMLITTGVHWRSSRLNPDHRTTIETVIPSSVLQQTMKYNSLWLVVNLSKTRSKCSKNSNRSYDDSKIYQSASTQTGLGYLFPQTGLLFITSW